MQLSDEDIYEAVNDYLPKVREYIYSHGIDIKFHGTKDAVVYMTLTTTASGYSISLITAKMLVQKKLHELIYPGLYVLNIDGTSVNQMPKDAYTGFKKIAES